MSIPTTVPPKAPREMTASELDDAGLLQAQQGVEVSRYALFVPADELGVVRPVVIRAGAVIGAFAIIHGGTSVAEQARIEEYAVIGKPERGYAVGRIHPGAGAATMIGAGSVVRSGAVVYADVQLGPNTLVGHHSLLRTGVQVGAETQLGHHLTVERATSIGCAVRCSPGSHITSGTRIADQVLLGSGIRTINDKSLTWRDPCRMPQLMAPRFETGARVGSNCTILAGVMVGEQALVGAGSLVTRDIPAGTLAYGCPARIHGRTRS